MQAHLDSDQLHIDRLTDWPPNFCRQTPTSQTSQTSGSNFTNIIISPASRVRSCWPWPRRWTNSNLRTMIREEKFCGTVYSINVGQNDIMLVFLAMIGLLEFIADGGQLAVERWFLSFISPYAPSQSLAAIGKANRVLAPSIWYSIFQTMNPGDQAPIWANFRQIVRLHNACTAC